MTAVAADRAAISVYGVASGIGTVNVNDIGNHTLETTH